MQASHTLYCQHRHRPGGKRLLSTHLAFECSSAATAGPSSPLMLLVFGSSGCEEWPRPFFLLLPPFLRVFCSSALVSKNTNTHRPSYSPSYVFVFCCCFKPSNCHTNWHVLHKQSNVIYDDNRIGSSCLPIVLLANEFGEQAWGSAQEIAEHSEPCGHSMSLTAP